MIDHSALVRLALEIAAIPVTLFSGAAILSCCVALWTMREYDRKWPRWKQRERIGSGNTDRN